MAKKKKIVDLEIPLGRNTLLPEAVPRNPVINTDIYPGSFRYIGGETSIGIWVWMSISSSGYLSSVYIPNETYGTIIYVRMLNTGTLEVSGSSAGAVRIRFYQLQY